MNILNVHFITCVIAVFMKCYILMQHVTDLLAVHCLITEEIPKYIHDIFQGYSNGGPRSTIRTAKTLLADRDWLL